MQYNKIALGNRIYYARKNKNLRQKEVSELLNLNQSTYSKIENGKCGITLETLYAISEILEVSIETLLDIGTDTELTSKELFDLERYKRFIISLRNEQ